MDGLTLDGRDGTGKGELIIDNNNQTDSGGAATVITSSVTDTVVGTVTIRGAGILKIDEAAVSLMTAPTDRSWRHMVELGATITWEAWDVKYKPNLDWNHAWGAAPANLLPRYILGVEPLTPGWATARIRPCPGGLDFARGKVPTPRGPILVEWNQSDRFTLLLEIPVNMRVRLELPAGRDSTGISQDGRPVNAQRIGDRWVLKPTVSGKTLFVVH